MSIIINFANNIGLRIKGVKTTGKLSSEQSNIIWKIVAEYISKIDKRSSDEVFNKLSRKGHIIKIQTMKSRKQRFMGLYQPINNNMYIQESVLNNISENNVETLKTLIHESLHKLQRCMLFFHGKSIRGLLEGCTQYMTLKIIDSKKSTTFKVDNKTVTINTPIISYMENVSIMNQLDIILGKDLISSLGLEGNFNFFYELRKVYGKDLYEDIRKTCNKFIKTTDLSQKINMMQLLQNKILVTCYNKKFENIKTADDAVSYLDELKSLELIRYRINGDTYFKEFFEQKYEEINQKFLKD